VLHGKTEIVVMNSGTCSALLRKSKSSEESELTAHRSRTVTVADAGSPTLDQYAVMVAWYPCLFHRTTAFLLLLSGPAHTYKQSRKFHFQNLAKALYCCAMAQTSSWYLEV
jgi:hypothetical protein